MTLNTFGTGQSSLVASDTTYSGVGSLDMFDSLTGDPGTSTYDTQGRITSYHVRDSYNNAFLSGDVSIGVVNSQLPVAIGALDKHYKNYMSLYWYEVFYTYAYDANGSQSYTSSESYQGTSIRIAAVSVTRSDEPVPVPEPSSLALTALGLVAFDQKFAATPAFKLTNRNCVSGVFRLGAALRPLNASGERLAAALGYRSVAQATPPPFAL